MNLNIKKYDFLIPHKKFFYLYVKIYSIYIHTYVINQEHNLAKIINNFFLVILF